MDLNTCFETTNYYHTIAFYSHIIPAIIALFLGIYVIRKTVYSRLSILFFAFSLAVCIWLFNDVILWIISNYYQVVFFWSWIDYINVLFFVLGVYFFGLLVRGNISLFEKITLIALCVPSFIFTITGNAIVDFDQTWCEAINNNSHVFYKVFVEYVSILLMLLSLFISFKGVEKKKKIQSIIVFLAMLLFFGTFSITEFMAAQTGIYEINLYGLFVLPIFLILITFSITNLGVFNIRYLGTQLLVYILILMIGSQFLFIQDATDVTLNAITIVIGIILGLLLLQNSKREFESKIKIEKLAKELEETNKHQITLIHFITHQVKGFFTKSRNIFAELINVEKELSATDKMMIKEGFESDTRAVNTVQDILKASNMRKGTIEYKKEKLNLSEVLEKESLKKKGEADAKGLEFKLDIEKDVYIEGDVEQLNHAIRNLVDNAIKYTPSGVVSIKLSQENGRVKVAIKDSGVGIDENDKKILFTEGGRGKDSVSVNIESTGFGLYIVKNIIEAHGGKIWVESEGKGKGSIFLFELPIKE